MSATLLPEPVERSWTVCLGRLDRSRTWTPTVAVRSGSRLVGVRASSEATALDISEHFADRLCPDLDTLAVANLSVERAEDVASPGRGFHVVHHDHVVVSRRVTFAETLLDLDELVAGLGAEPSPGVLLVAAAAVLRPDGSAVLLPAAWHRHLTLHDRRVRSLGLQTLPSTRLTLEPGPVPGGLTLLRTRAGEESRHPVDTWAFMADTDDVYALTPAVGVGRAFGCVHLATADARATLHQLATAAGTMRFTALPPVGGAGLAEVALQVAGA